MNSQNWTQYRGRCGAAGIAAFLGAPAAEPDLILQQPDCVEMGRRPTTPGTDWAIWQGDQIKLLPEMDSKDEDKGYPFH
ncbi:uncharacterized protein GLRG_03813 [Colletotrichum graminicola M1.001]|uniref:Uncharacterized protein n=1 Tax=Colletotrichum graminicola (strain M1.001 / M2 / FGSC 10212) TaxID=645133 RepID=E3QCT1_COLGM|nr:uncharacterized protein GLRG_03813 [Colletotrichum graminicola M1.001]EFQ28669.1 hypothetical protein GLRG_03813 [Colletotrichum graminicola M1.001]